MQSTLPPQPLWLQQTQWQQHKDRYEEKDNNDNNNENINNKDSKNSNNQNPPSECALDAIDPSPSTTAISPPTKTTVTAVHLFFLEQG